MEQQGRTAWAASKVGGQFKRKDRQQSQDVRRLSVFFRRLNFNAPQRAAESAGSMTVRARQGTTFWRAVLSN